jgi:hypothetical protein
MFKRHNLEKKEGKTYNEPGVRSFSIDFDDISLSRQVSAEMKALNRRFLQLHGLSSSANLCAVIALVFHGLWIGNVDI